MKPRKPQHISDDFLPTPDLWLFLAWEAVATGGFPVFMTLLAIYWILRGP